MPERVDFLRPARISGLSLSMTHAAPQHLANRLAELLMSQLLPCDLGDGIEVIHDVEAIEVEMECDLDESAPVELVEPDPGDTVVMLKQWFDEIEIPEDAGTHQFIRLSAPYERIEIEIDPNAYRRATIAHARKLATVIANSDAKGRTLRRPRHALARHQPAGSPETR